MTGPPPPQLGSRMQDLPDKVNYERFLNKSLQRTLFRTRSLELT